MGLWKVLRKRFYGLGNRGIGVLDLKMYGFGELWGKLGIIFFVGDLIWNISEMEKNVLRRMFIIVQFSLI